MPCLKAAGKSPDSLQNETLVGIVTTGDHAGKMIREISNDWSRRVCGVALLEATGMQSVPRWRILR